MASKQDQKQQQQQQQQREGEGEEHKQQEQENDQKTAKRIKYCMEMLAEHGKDISTNQKEIANLKHANLQKLISSLQ